jgi:hypothetical protein
VVTALLGCNPYPFIKKESTLKRLLAVRPKKKLINIFYGDDPVPDVTRNTIKKT